MNECMLSIISATRRLSLVLLIVSSIFSETAGSDHSDRTNKFGFGRERSADTSKVHDIIRKGFMLLSEKSSAEKLKQYIDSAVNVCEKHNIDFPASLHALAAEYHYLTGDFRTASEEAIAAIQVSTENNEHEIAAKSMIFMGRYYNRTGFYKESLEYYDNSIIHAGKYGLKGIIPRAYHGQAMVFNQLKDIKQYRQKLQQMAEAAMAEKDTASTAWAIYLHGTSMCGQDEKYRDSGKADSLLRKSLELALSAGNPSIISSSLANIGWNFYLGKNYDSSLYYYNKSLEYNIPANLHEATANALGNLGTIYRDLNKPEKSIEYYLEAIDHAKKVNDWYDLRWIYEDMSQMYLRLKDTANAFKSYVLFKQFSDSMMIRERSQGLQDALLRYEADTHNKEVELLSLRLKNNRLLNYGFASILILTLALGILLFRGSKLKAKRRISEMNRQISEITQANLRQQMNPHFIFNTLNSIQYYMYQHDKLATNNYLTKFSNLMRRVLENSRHTSIPLSDELSALKLYLELESIRFKEKFDFEINVDEEIDPMTYKIPTMLIQPYVENSICHGLMPKEGKGIVKIDLKLQNGYLLCLIEDNGIGRDAARERKLNRGDNHNSLGTRIISSRLDLVNALYGTSLKTIYTDLKNNRGEPEGTRVEIHIPIIT